MKSVTERLQHHILVSRRVIITHAHVANSSYVKTVTLHTKPVGPMLSNGPHFREVINLMQYLPKGPKPRISPFVCQKHLSETRTGAYIRFMCPYMCVCDILAISDQGLWQQEEILIIREKWDACKSHVSINRGRRCFLWILERQEERT